MNPDLQQCLEQFEEGDWSDLDLCVIHAQCSLWLVFFANDNSMLNPWNDRVMQISDLPLSIGDEEFSGTQEFLDMAGQLETASEMFELTQAVANQIKLRIES